MTTVSYRIDYTKVDTDLENFPVDIWITSSGIPTAVFNSFFTNDTFKPTEFKVINPENDEELYTEISYYNYSYKEMMLHVKVPEVYSDKYSYVDIVPTTSGVNEYVCETGGYIVDTTVSGDNFNGGASGSLDSDLWTISKSAPTSAEIYDNKARVTIPLSAADEAVSLIFNYNIEGDFDIRVDYEEVFLDKPSTSISYTAQLRLTFGSENVQIGTTSNSTTPYMLVASSGGEWTQVTPHYPTGKLRITRVGSTLKGYIWSGSQWEWSGNVAGHQFLATGAERLTINLSSSADFNGGCTIDFDNFEIVSGDVATFPSNQVWDSDYSAVYHMTQDPSGGTDCILDSTSNLEHANPIGGMVATDLVATDFGKGIEFNTLDKFIQVPDGVWDNIISTLTISMEYSSGNGIVFAKGGSGESVDTNLFRTDWQTSQVNYYYEQGSGGTNYDFGQHALVDNPRDGNWNTVVAFVDVATFRAGINGQFISSVSTAPSNNTDSTAGTAIGPASASLPVRTYSSFFGTVRDVRVSSIIRSDVWEEVTSYSLNNDLVDIIYPMTCEGTVEGQLPDIVINLHRRIDGNLVGSTTTNSSGTFSIGSVYVEDHYIVALYSDNSLNALIYDYISPTYSGS